MALWLSRIACSKDFRVLWTACGLRKISVEAAQTMTRRAHLFLRLNSAISSMSCSASSNLFLPSLTFVPLRRLTYCWSKTAFIGLIFWSGVLSCASSSFSSTPAVSAAS